MSEPVRVAIVGAGGRVGSALLAHLSAEPGISAFGICRNAVVAGPVRLAGLDVRCGTIRDHRSADELVGGADVVVNCAVDAGWASTTQEANRRPLRALSGAAGVRRLIQFSSIGVYGTCITRGRSTSARPRPYARYAQEKLDQERAARQCERSEMTVIVRMGHVYGPYQWLSRTIFGWLEGGQPRLPFDGAIASNAIFHRERVPNHQTARPGGACRRDI